jgi:hypothetical protein
MTQFPNQNKLPHPPSYPPLPRGDEGGGVTDFNVIAKFRTETSASISVSSRLPVILLRKSSHIPNLLQV